MIGAGVVGLTIARELKIRYPDQSVTVIEKEDRPGTHSSGRNSGVLHSGIYYPATSLKAKVCGQGAREMAEYCAGHSLSVNRIGKILVPIATDDGPQLDVLAARGRENGIGVEELDERQLREAEPEARSATGRALFVPSTAVVDAQKVMTVLVRETRELGVRLLTGTGLVDVHLGRREIRCSSEVFKFGHVINAAGLHADKIAHLFGVGRRYTLLPFKGIYWRLRPDAGLSIRHLVYPVPDLRVPFLGIHTTNTTDGHTYLGPTAVPAFGRESYHGWQDVYPKEAVRISLLLVRQYVSGRDGFRQLAWQEGRRCFKPWFTKAAQALLPRLRVAHLQRTSKVGIRAQLLDRESGRLVNDFVVERGEHSTHILNAISPAFTSAFPFSRYVVDSLGTP